MTSQNVDGSGFANSGGSDVTPACQDVAAEVVDPGDSGSAPSRAAGRTPASTAPWWHLDPCPSWCAGDHERNEPSHVEDHLHAVEVNVPVIRAGSPPFRNGADVVEGLDFIVVMRRYAGQSETWLYVGDGENTNRSIEITVESARRLVTVLGRLVA